VSHCATPLEHGLAGARERFEGFLDALDPAARVVVFCHFDADGLAAGALAGRGLARLGFGDVQVIPSLRGESAFADGARERIARLEPRALIVTDLGVRAEGVLAGVPSLYVDHHRPVGEPADAVVVTGYGWEPIPCSAWLMYELLAPRVEMEDLGWIAAVGTLSDLGDAAPWPPLAAVKKRYTAKWLKEAVSLVNAARRASSFDLDTPLRLLMEADHPRAVSDDATRGADRLHAYRAEVKEELQKARRAAPLFASSGPFALIRFHSPCQIHPLIAQQWRGRLRDFGVIAANTGYLPGQVAFSMRTVRGDLNLLDSLRAVDLGEYNQKFGFGHDQATGGHLPPPAFNQLMTALGFDGRARV
jgi:single-stranded-DNA-specific exonuclease